MNTYHFVNKEGKTRSFPGNTTLLELMAAGVTDLGFVKQGSPPPEDPNAYVHTETEEKKFHTSVAEAKANGWLKPYAGNHGRIYGYKPGNHRVWRCYWANPSLS